MRYRRLLITVSLGLGCLFALFVAMNHAPVLHAATPVPVAQTTTQQAEPSQGVLAQLVITPTKDNTLYESTAGDTSNGAGQYFFAGKTSRDGSIRRGLLAFDLSSKLPVSATIVSATLQLHMSRTSSDANAVTLRRVLANWGEGSSNANSNEGSGATATTGDATWLHTFFNTSLWQTAGGVFAPTTTATVTVGGIDFYRWSSPALVADVQGWVSNPNSNFGWVVIGTETESGTAKRFDARESPVAANRPQLTIVYRIGEAEAVAVYLPLIRK